MGWVGRRLRLAWTAGEPGAGGPRQHVLPSVGDVQIGQTPLAIGRTDDPALGYAADARTWSVWWPCRTCGGVTLPLHEHPVVSVAGYEPVARLRGRCPGCETRRRRSLQAVAEPSVWYDTLLCDWVVRLPSAAGPAILPLEIYWFDASFVHVYRTASDLVYSGEAFEREPGD